jgi:iduronate 2-sulfatase
MIERTFINESEGDFFKGDINFGFIITRTFQLRRRTDWWAVRMTFPDTLEAARPDDGINIRIRTWWAAGLTWFLQFFFYGMGESKLGNGASSWMLHTAFIIFVSNSNSQDPEWNSPGEGELVQRNPFGVEPAKQGRNLMSIVKAEGDDADYIDGKTADKASALIRKHKDKPFFLAVGFVRPHVPFVVPKSYFEPYPYQQMVLPAKVVNDWDDIPEKGINYVTSVNGQMSEDQQKKAVAAYYACVASMDRQLGKVLNTLKEEGLEKKTIVIFTSDHGFHLGEHDFWMKVSLREESARVPLIIKVPGKKPAVCHSLVELLDLYPTVAELAGLKTSPHIQGKSLVKTFDDPGHKVRDMAFSVSPAGEALLVRTEKWSFIQYGEDGSGGMELFDVEMDPKQYNNLAHIPQYQKVVENMQQRLKAKLREVRSNDLNINYADN